ncbi:UDP-4-amino-4,6-dideoxy-N-acetyl-beta-L-altrosamine N-acetyltransferase [Acinetobacter baumannii]|uniref:UDP-4-amino-4, 6-dideoxy-N-acetyl-beta-L-altrosamine N-acetyltransferase n=1 Tax=Acinetobacter baumannii TaxID=470 RepID=UPI002447CDCA|nr:UDP-4-amino-4,6-dideoxy-N-acetyl-beta-L-altrosamine N-acetyltransferase [Acinetobacter baumannii]MDH2608039.1 UDP-4-amino-4,6-dideoxy-N-acetyl-beta-L-altrosamine N-acetyltransferase [Acinetobacter baumannii]MDO7423860.1 UDP-4-amino-4,6-dideoxy-N-acetyl-beta-L-altrosamine N-acetyltransferase [Acinetobacter baumannii]
MFKGKIRPVQLKDAEMILTWRNQDSVRTNMYNHDIIELDAHLKWFNSILVNDTCRYFIYEQNNTPLGVLSFNDIDFKNKKASWAFYSGDTTVRGIGSEMEQLALDYAFNELDLNKLCCEVLEFNFAVVNFHRKFGFKMEGIKKQDYYRDGKFYDIYQLALFKKDYQKIQSQAYSPIEKSYVWSFSIPEKKIDQFATLSGDKNPVHLDKEAAISLGFENRIAHGALLVAEISKVAAMDYPSRNAIYLGQNLDFKAPIYPNVELTGKAKLKTQIGRYVIIEYGVYQEEKLIAQGESEFLLS